ncbi:MAG: response regulator transcription factor [Chloroflexota bacterium]
MQRIRLFIFDTDPYAAESLSLSLSQEESFVTQFCTDHTTLAQNLTHFLPHIALINVHDNDLSGGFCVGQLIATQSQKTIVVFFVSRYVVEQETILLDAIMTGASGILVREETDLATLVATLKKLDYRISLFNPRQLRKELQVRHIPDNNDYASFNFRSEVTDAELESLTSREQEVANLLMRGTSTVEIAQKLSISKRTVHNHISSILGKLGVRNRSEAIVYLHNLPDA